MLSKQTTEHVLAGEYRGRKFGSVDATQAAEWEREMMQQLCESYACEKEDEKWR